MQMNPRYEEMARNNASLLVDEEERGNRESAKNNMLALGKSNLHNLIERLKKSVWEPRVKNLHQLSLLAAQE